MGRSTREAFIHSIAVISDMNPGNMNDLLKPQFVECDEEEKTSTIRYEIDLWERNQKGQVHGGAVSAMFDVSMGVSIAAFSQRDVTTAEMEVSYIRPFIGDVYDFKTTVIHMGSKMARVECKAYDIATGKLTATSHAAYAFLGPFPEE